MKETETGVGAWPIQIEGLQFRHRIGSGCFGEVYQAYQVGLDRDVAVKLLGQRNPANSSVWLEVGQLPPGDSISHLAPLDQAIREAQILAKLTHPYIVSIHDAGVSGDHAYLVMDYIAGGNLRDWLTRYRKAEAEQVVRWVGQLAEGLDYLHQQEIIHGDLKPTNVLCSQSGYLLLTDFGLARAWMSDPHVSRGRDEGPPVSAYWAPEQQAELALDARVDQYALAAISYELLTGLPPSPRMTPASQLDLDLPPGLDEVLARGLSEEPGDRYSTVLEFAQTLSEALREPVSAKSIAKPNSPWRWILPVTISLGVLLAALILASDQDRTPSNPADQDSVDKTRQREAQAFGPEMQANPDPSEQPGYEVAVSVLQEFGFDPESEIDMSFIRQVIGRSRELREPGQYHRAIGMIHALITLRPDILWMQQELAWIYRDMGQYLDELEIRKNLIAQDFKKSINYLRAGRALRQSASFLIELDPDRDVEQDRNEAYGFLLKGLEGAEPEDVFDYWIELAGLAGANPQRRARVKEILQAAIERSGEDPTPHLALAWMRVAPGPEADREEIWADPEELTQARRDLQTGGKLIGQNDNSADYSLVLRIEARLAFLEADHARAIDLINRSIESAPESWRTELYAEKREYRGDKHRHRPRGPSSRGSRRADRTPCGSKAQSDQSMSPHLSADRRPDEDRR